MANLRNVKLEVQKSIKVHDSDNPATSTKIWPRQHDHDMKEKQKRFDISLWHSEPYASLLNCVALAAIMATLPHSITGLMKAW